MGEEDLVAEARHVSPSHGGADNHGEPLLFRTIDLSMYVPLSISVKLRRLDSTMINLLRIQVFSVILVFFFGLLFFGGLGLLKRGWWWRMLQGITHLKSCVIRYEEE